MHGEADASPNERDMARAVHTGSSSRGMALRALSCSGLKQQYSVTHCRPALIHSRKKARKEVARAERKEVGDGDFRQKMWSSGTLMTMLQPWKEAICDLCSLVSTASVRGFRFENFER